MKVNILGTEYTITECSKEEDKMLDCMDGYCDKTTKSIVITTPTSDCDLGDWKVYRNKIMRHEIVHAYLFESGLHENFEHQQWGHEETMVDWIAIQFPKMYKTFQEVGCI